MAKHRHKNPHGGSEVDMTPMIDVVFQLIIFFIVTLKMEEKEKETIELADSKHGPPIVEEDPRTLVVEVDRFGWISIRGANFTPKEFQNIMKARFKRFGEFPVLIRGDHRAKHKDIRAVMDICTSVGIWRINFAAIKEHKRNKK